MEEAALEEQGESEGTAAAVIACLEEGQIAVESRKTREVEDVAVAENTKTDEDVQRAIDGLKEIPDEELQEFLDDEDFMEGLDVVDAWEGEEDQGKIKKRRSRGRDKERKRLSRDRIRHRERPKREERKREESRRDPSKSTKDIERDKIRTKKDSESKILAEKEKAIKYLLDSDNVVPPGTEEEAIETIAEKQNLERLMPRRRSKERRRSIERQRLPLSQKWRRSPERIVRLSPYVRRRSALLLSPEQRRSVVRLSPERRRSPLRLSPAPHRSPHHLSSDHRRSPLLLSPDRRRSPLRLSPDRARRLSWERRSSGERRWSTERYRKRIETHERDLRLPSRRSRSRDRHRSRSLDRHRRRYSRSPIDRRFSPRRRSRSRSRSNSRGRSPERRVRKRSPFINEITRQFRKEGILPTPTLNTGYMGPPLMGMVPNMMGPAIYPHEVKPMPPGHYMPHQPGPGMPMPGMPGYINFEPAPPPINFDAVAPQPLPPAEFSSGPVLYSNPNTTTIRTLNRITLISQSTVSPQPVPPPSPSGERESLHYVPQVQQLPRQKSPSGQKRPESANKDDGRSSTPYNGLRTTQKERLRTPDPPVISNAKVSPSPFGKTSLSSLLEASVSAKDSTALPVLYPGFKPEILRHCEHALRDLPSEDPRLKMKGRFFFNPKKDEAAKDSEGQTSNSILLQKERNKVFWDEEEERHSQSTVKGGAQMHQKICQTDEVLTEDKFAQASVATADFSVQVIPYDIQQASKEDKRPIMDRLDWNNRETFDYAPKPREVDDLRWSLSNSAQKRPWGRASSPPRAPESRGPSGDGVSSGEYSSRSINHGSPGKSRDEFHPHRIPNREHYSRESHSQSYRDDDDDRQDEFQDNRSDHSRGESPMVLEDSAEELEEEQDAYSRSSEWRGRGRIFRGRSITAYRGRGAPRGKYLGSRPFRARASFRGKF